MTVVPVNVDFGGPSLAGQPVKVYDHGTQNLSALVDQDGVTPLANPVSLTGTGHALFLATPGTYDLVSQDRTRTVVVTDPANAPVRGSTLTSPAGHVFTLSVDDLGHLVTTPLP